MSKKIVQMISVIVLISVIINSPVMKVNATDLPAKAPPNVAQGMTARGEMIIQPRSLFLKWGYCVIGKSGVGKILVTTSTTATQIVDSIYTKVDIEQWNPNSNAWITFKTFNREVFNTDVLEFDQTVEVARGYYYRSKVYHRANTEYSYSFSESIWVG